MLLGILDDEVTAAEDHLAQVLPLSPFAGLTTVPGWAVVRAAGYGAAVGDPAPVPAGHRGRGLGPSLADLVEPPLNEAVLGAWIQLVVGQDGRMPRGEIECGQARR